MQKSQEVKTIKSWLNKIRRTLIKMEYFQFLRKHLTIWVASINNYKKEMKSIN